MIREKDWRVYAKRADFNEIAGRLGISPVMARVLVNRDLDTYEKQDRKDNCYIAGGDRLADRHHAFCRKESGCGCHRSRF